INLCGRTVNCRYTPQNKQEILDSRIQPTQTLGKAIVLSPNPPKAWFNASSATIYDHSLNHPMDEVSGLVGEGFSVDVCQKREKALNDVPLRATRKVALRITIVFGPGGDATRAFRRVVRLGLGGKMGRGNQMVSWIHAEDFVRAVNWILDHQAIQGPV